MIVERRVAAMGIVPAFDKVEDCHARFDLSFEAAAVEQFAFERGEKTLAHRVIEAIADRAHRGPHAGLLTTFTEGERSILAAMIGMMDHAARTALAEGHVERLEDQLGTQRGLHRPTHDAPAEHIE